jgi:hypothetical protein
LLLIAFKMASIAFCFGIVLKSGGRERLALHQTPCSQLYQSL